MIPCSKAHARIAVPDGGVDWVAADAAGSWPRRAGVRDGRAADLVLPAEGRRRGAGAVAVPAAAFFTAGPLEVPGVVVMSSANRFHVAVWLRRFPAARQSIPPWLMLSVPIRVLPSRTSNSTSTLPTSIALGTLRLTLRVATSGCYRSDPYRSGRSRSQRRFTSKGCMRHHGGDQEVQGCGPEEVTHPGEYRRGLPPGQPPSWRCLGLHRAAGEHWWSGFTGDTVAVAVEFCGVPRLTAVDWGGAGVADCGAVGVVDVRRLLGRRGRLRRGEPGAGGGCGFKAWFPLSATSAAARSHTAHCTPACSPGCCRLPSTATESSRRRDAFGRGRCGRSAACAARLAGAADVVGGQSTVVRGDLHRLVHLGC